jgi:hypothetical protein
VSDKKQKRSERQAQREALRKWRQHEPLTKEEYKLLRKKGYFGSGAKPKTLRGGAPGLRQQDGDEFKGRLPRILIPRTWVNRAKKR